MILQSGAAFNALLEESTKSGAQLEDYKQQLLDTQLTLTGLLSLQGKTGANAKHAGVVKVA